MNVLVAQIIVCGWALVGSAMHASAAQPSEDPSRTFFERYCHNCHARPEPEGEFQVDTLMPDFADQENRQTWLNVVEQVKTGTMPPEGEPRPPVDEAQALVKWIEAQIADAEAARIAEQGRAVMRRLNQTEYENTVRDLLSVDLDLEGVLPVDLAPGGFDTSVDMLHFSSYLLDGYLVAADLVLDEAFAGGQRPTLVQRRLDPKDEVATQRRNVYRHLDDGVAIFSSDLASNIQIVFWKFHTRARGKYRFRISAYAYQSEEPVLFHINGGTDNLGDPPFLIDYFEAPPGEPTVVEFVETLEPGRNIRLLVDTKIRPWEIERTGGAADYAGPGLVLQWVEVEGPLGETWPPPSYHRLFVLHQEPADPRRGGRLRARPALGVRSAEPAAAVQSLCQHAPAVGDRGGYVQHQHRHAHRLGVSADLMFPGAHQVGRPQNVAERLSPRCSGRRTAARVRRVGKSVAGSERLLCQCCGG